MNRSELINQIQKKKSVLCIGLDSDVARMPDGIEKMPEGVLKFNKEIIEKTHDLAVSYKLNTAFYESMGAAGWQVMEETLKLIPEECFTIADAKRGDIGNTAEQYRYAFLENLDFDAITVNPYMGLDSIDPYFEIGDKWVILLGLTSNAGSKDIQELKLENGQTVYQNTIRISSEKYSSEQLMYVVGATKDTEIEVLRKLLPEYFFLVPGVGAQGGSLDMVMKKAYHPDNAGLLVNVSRDIIFKSKMTDFASRARESALEYQKQMANYI